MKKFNIMAIVLFALLSASAFASTNLSSYYSTMHPNTTTALKNMLHPPTDITVFNATSNYMFVVVPNSVVDDVLSPGATDHIYNFDPNCFSTYIVLQDPSRHTFYTNNVCRYAIVTVTGRPGYYRITLDSTLCY